MFQTHAKVMENPGQGISSPSTIKNFDAGLTSSLNTRPDDNPQTLQIEFPTIPLLTDSAMSSAQGSMS